MYIQHGSDYTLYAFPAVQYTRREKFRLATTKRRLNSCLKTDRYPRNSSIVLFDQWMFLPTVWILRKVSVSKHGARRLELVVLRQCSSSYSRSKDKLILLADHKFHLLMPSPLYSFVFTRWSYDTRFARNKCCFGSLTIIWTLFTLIRFEVGNMEIWSLHRSCSIATDHRRMFRFRNRSCAHGSGNARSVFQNLGNISSWVHFQRA